MKNPLPAISRVPFGAFLLCGALQALSAAEPFSPKLNSAPITLETLTIAPGTEWVERLESTYVNVRTTSRPHFGQVSSGVVIMEVGPASVSFLQDDFGGVLVLLGAEEKVLPYVIALGDDGRSRAPLNLSLSYDAVLGEARLQIADAVHTVAAKRGGEAVDAILSAGMSEAWTLEHLEVSTAVAADSTKLSSGSPSTVGGVDGPRVHPTKAEMFAYKEKRLRASAEARELMLKNDRIRAERALFASNRHAPGTLGWHLESATKLTHMALTLRQNYQMHKAVEVGLRAQTFLREAEALAANQWPKSQAAVHELAGFVWGEVMHDPQAAEKEFDKALAFYPEAPRALEAKRRLAADAARHTATANAEKR